MRYQDPRLAELLAAEYVLGTLRGGARRRFEALLQAHPILRSRVRAWEWQVNRLVQAAPEVPPPAATWERLEQRLFPAAARPRWFQRLAFWRSLALGSSLLAGVLVVLLLVSPFPRPETGYVGMITDAAHQTVWMISASGDMGKLHVKNMKPLDLPPDRRCLLWVRPKGSQTLYALGALPEKGNEMTLKIPRDMRPMLPGRLIVTVESMNGAMPDRPTGRPEYEGEWVPLG